MTQNTRRRPRAWLALLLALAFALAACAGSDADGGASFGPADDGSGGTDPMATSGPGY